MEPKGSLPHSQVPATCPYYLVMALTSNRFYPTNQPTTPMEKTPSWEPDSFLITQEIPCILWNAKVPYD
jgi:hypothetical protein